MRSDAEERKRRAAGALLAETLRAGAIQGGWITVVRVAGTHGDEDCTVEVHERDCPCGGCAQWRAA